jgi:drug/metabolite transporter (DMT)-like permease
MSRRDGGVGVNMKKALFYGVLASFFFAFTFILNRSMNLSGGYWLWSACLRYLFMLPMLFLLVWRQKDFRVIEEIRKYPLKWILWSTIGFGLFYVSISLASVYGESWLVASSWQITIVAGILLTPLFGKRIPLKNLGMSFLILLGVFLLQVPEEASLDAGGSFLVLLPILVAAFSYPLGNRKMMEICPGSLPTIQRVFGMTLCSMPFWLVLSVVSWNRVGMPSSGQIAQSVLVALLSGVLATILFFKATEMVKENPRQLALIEATQSGEVVFALLGGIVILNDQMPTMLGMSGILLIIIGMVLSSLVSGQPEPAITD